MTPLQIVLKPITDASKAVGFLYFANGANQPATHYATFYTEWNHRAKKAFDDPETAWKEIPLTEIMPAIVLDSDENLV